MIHMASIFRRTYKVTLPNGKTVKRKVTTWTIQYKAPDGSVKRKNTEFTDKDCAKQQAAKIEREVEHKKADLVDVYAPHRARKFTEHVADYVADLKAKGRDDMYVYNTERRLSILAEGCPWRTLADVTADSFIRWRAVAMKERTKCVEKTTDKPGKAISARTVNQFLETARAFLNWCAAMDRTPGVQVNAKLKVSPLLAGVDKVTGEVVRVRRALTDEQVATILAKADDWRKLPYRLGLATGLRRQELEDLQWGDVRLQAIPPYIQLRAQATKARRGDRLDLPQTLADELRKAKPEDAADNARVLPNGVPSMRLWRKDLKAAGVDYRDAQGRRADFHGGTRKTLCSRLHKAGVPLAVAMKRMRHTDAKLTMVDYTDADQIGMDRATLPEVIEAQQTPQTPATVATA
jgi:integrase